MKFQRIFFLACSQAINNKNNGNISLIDVFEGITATELPVAFGPFTLVARFKATGVIATSPKTLPIELKIHSPKGKIISSKEPVGEVGIDRTNKEQSLGAIINVPFMVFEEIDSYRIELLVGGQSVDTLEISVNFQEK